MSLGWSVRLRGSSARYARGRCTRPISLLHSGSNSGSDVYHLGSCCRKIGPQVQKPSQYTRDNPKRGFILPAAHTMQAGAGNVGDEEDDGDDSDDGEWTRG